MSTFSDWVAKLKSLVDNPPALPMPPTPVAAASSSLAEFPFVKQTWIVPGSGVGGTGTKDSPIQVLNGDLDQLAVLSAPSFRLNLLPGVYHTRGIKLPWHASIVGSGRDNTIIRLKNDVKATNGYWPNIRVLSDHNYCGVLHLSDFTIDCNWQGQSEGLTNGNFKIDGLVINVVKALVERIGVINFGVNGKNYPPSQGLEGFPLCLYTYSSGSPWKYHDGFKVKIGDESDVSKIVIRDCRVEKPHFLNGGYCSAIFVQTSQGADRQPANLRDNLCALIENNYVHVPGGIGLGAAISEQVEFRNNVVIDSVCGFNLDTGRMKGLKLIRNHFLGVNQGINVVPGEASSDVTIQENTVALTTPYYNPGFKTYTPYFWLKSGELIKSGLITKGNYLTQLDVKMEPSDLDQSKVGNFIM